MSLDRTAFDQLVDDTGSNNGTIWSKDKIKVVVLDPVDAALVPLVVTAVPNDGSNAGELVVFADSSGKVITTGDYTTDEFAFIHGMNIFTNPQEIGGANPFIRLGVFDLSGKNGLLQARTGTTQGDGSPGPTLLLTLDPSGNLTVIGTLTAPSPQFTGVPTAPTAALGTNTTQIATTEFVQAALAVMMSKVKQR